MADVIDYNIFGNDMQVVEEELDAGEGVRAESGAMLCMDEGIEMQTSSGCGALRRRGLHLAEAGRGTVLLSFMPEARCWRGNSNRGRSLWLTSAAWPRWLRAWTT